MTGASDLSELELVVKADKAIANLDRYDSAVNRSSRSNSLFEDGVSSLTKTLGALATVRVFGSVVSDAMNFESQMALVETVTDTTTVSMNALGAAALKTFRDLPVKSLDDVTKGMYDIISAGVPAGDAIAYIGVAAKSAVAGVSTTAVAVDALTTATNAWRKDNLTAQQAADQMFMAVNKGKMTFSELASSIGTIAPVAAAYNIKLSDVLGSTAQLTLAGLSTSEAMVGIRSAITNVINPTGKLAEQFPALAKEFNGAKLEAVGFAQFLVEFNKAAGGSKDAINALFSDVQGKTAVFSLLSDGGKALQQQVEAVANATGSMDTAFDIATATSSALNQHLRNELKATLVEIGTDALPAVNTGLSALLVPLQFLGDNVDGVVTSLGFMATLVAGRFLSGGVEKLTGFATGIAATRQATILAAAEVAAHAVETTRETAATLASAEADKASQLTLLQHTAAVKADLLAERELAVARLNRANASLAVAGNQLAQPGLNALGGAVVERQQRAFAVATTEAAAAQSTLANASRVANVELAREIEILTALGAAEARVTALSAELAVAQGAAAGATTALGAATSRTTALMATAGTAAKALWTAMGGWVGAGLIALYAIYSTIKRHIDDAKKSQDELNEATRRSVQGLELAQLASQYRIVQDEIKRTKAALESMPQAPLSGFIPGGSVDRTGGRRAGLQDDLNKLLQQEATIRPILDNAIKTNSISRAADTKTIVNTTGAINEQLAAYETSRASAQLELEHQTALAAASNFTARQIEDLNAQYAVKAKLQALDASLSNSQRAIMTELIINTASQEAAVRANNRALEDSEIAWQKGGDQMRIWAAEAREVQAQALKSRSTIIAANESWKTFAKNFEPGKTFIPDFKLDTRTWVDDANKVLGIVQLIGSGLSAAGQAFGTFLNEAAQSFRSAIQSSKDLQKLDDKSSFADAASAVGGWVGAIISIGSAWGNFMSAREEETRRAEEAQRAYNNALSDFSNATKRAIDQLIEDQKRLANKLIAENPVFKDTTQPLYDDPSQLKKRIDELSPNRTDKDISRILGALEPIYNTWVANLARIRQRTEEELRQIDGSNNVRELRLQGLSAEADRMSALNEVQRQFEEAVDKYGATAEVTRQKVLGLAEAEKAYQDALAAENRRATRSGFDTQTQTLAFTDSRYANETRFMEDLRRKVEDAATPLEKFQAEVYATAAALDFYKQRLEADTQQSEGFANRVLSSLGDKRAAEDFARNSANRQENFALENSDASPFNVEFARFTQSVEQSRVTMLRAIEDATAAINAQADTDIAANNALLDLDRQASTQLLARIDGQIADEKEMRSATEKFYDDSIRALEDQKQSEAERLDRLIAGSEQQVEYASTIAQSAQAALQDRQRAAAALNDSNDKFALSNASTLSPFERRLEALRQLTEQASLARAGNNDAALKVPELRDAFLEASRTLNASGTAYGTDVALASGITTALAERFNSMLSLDQQNADRAQASLVVQQNILEGLRTQKDEIIKGLDKQIDTLQEDKDLALKQYDATLEGLQLARDTETKRFATEEARYAALNSNIRLAADAQIEAARVREEAAHADRARSFPFYDAYQSFLNGGTAEQGNLPPIQFTTPTFGETQIVGSLANLLTEQRRQLDSLAIVATNAQATANAVAASGTNIVAKLEELAARFESSNAGVTRVLDEVLTK